MAAEFDQAEVSPVNASVSTSQTTESHGNNNAGSGLVAKLKSFHLRFAGKSTVRKKRPKVRNRRDDFDDEDDSDSLDGAEESEATREDGSKQDGRDSQEVRILLAQKLAQQSNQSDLSTEEKLIPDPITEVLQQDTNLDDSTPNQPPANGSRNELDREIITNTSLAHPQDEEEESYQSSDPDAFKFYPTEYEPHIPPDIQNRAKEAFEDVIEDIIEISDGKQSCLSTCCSKIQPRRLPGDGSVPEFTPLLSQASKQGLTFMRSFLNPSMPRAVRDTWVLIELAVTIYQFVLASLSLAERHTEVFNVLYVVIASIALLLSVIDVMVHCVQLGSFASCLLFFRSKITSEHQQSQPESIQPCCLFSKKWIKRVNNSLELVRSIISELIFYPLLICDMFDFIATGSYRYRDIGQKINFSLFIVGGFYLVLAVYLVRMLMIGFSLYSLRRIPQSASHTQGAYVNLSIKFGIHILGQMLLSVVVIAAIGMKIREENAVPCSNGSCVSASGFLIYAIITGGLIPLLGIFSFFFINIYKIRVMSVSFLVDMVSMLQSESFTSVVFAKQGITKAKTMAQSIAQKVQIVEVRKQLKGVIKSMPSWAKRLYPLRFPAFWVFGIFYFLILASYIAALFLSEEDPGENSETTTFLTAGALLIVVNIHFIFLFLLLVAIIAVILLLVLLSPALLVVAVILYVPVGCFLSCLHYLHDLGQEMSVFSKPSVHKHRIQTAVRQELHK